MMPRMEHPTRLRASAIAFGVAALALVYLAAPFLVVILAALVAVVVSYPLFQRLQERMPRWGAATVLTAGVVLVILVPVGFASWMAARQIVDVATQGVAFASEGGFTSWVESAVQQLPDEVAAWVYDPDTLQSAEETVQGLLRDLFTGLLNRAGPVVTDVISAVAEGFLQAGVFIVVLWTLYVEGPTLAETLRRISPLPDAQMERLYAVLTQFAWNVVVGMLATSMGQGVVAAIGFAIIGARNIALLAILTGIASQVPMVGAAVVWAPVAISYLVHGQWGAALFITAWSLALTASVDNVAKPFIYRQGLRVHPALVLVSLLGGLLTFGPAGLLVGPFVLVLFLALLTFHDPDSPAARAAEALPSGDGEADPSPSASEQKG